MFMSLHKLFTGKQGDNGIISNYLNEIDIHPSVNVLMSSILVQCGKGYFTLLPHLHQSLCGVYSTVTDASK